MDTLDDLIGDITDNRNGKANPIIENFITSLIENTGCDNSKLEKQFHCNISFLKEKQNSLQYTYYYTITSKLIDCELYLVIESGINNGTQLNSYSFISSIVPESRTIEVLIDVILDESKYENSKYSLDKAKAIFPLYKEKILEIYRKLNYDNYVTGGGFNKNNYSQLNEIKNLGIFFEEIYGDVECDINLV